MSKRFHIRFTRSTTGLWRVNVRLGFLSLSMPVGRGPRTGLR